MSDFGKKGMNKPLEIAEESEDNVLFNQQREEGNKEKTEGIADGINQCSHLSDTTTSMSTSESCYVETFEEKTLSAHINEDGKNASTKLLCKPCSTDYEQVEATQFCKTCDDPDPVCNTCAKHHLRQKLSKDHEMCTDIEKFRELEQKKCKNKSTELFCELCFADDVKVEATHFCKTCDDPDPLCETCAKYHLRQKLSKDHEMCADIEEFKKMKQNACDNMSERLLCEPCSTDNVQIEATRFCKTCDDPEPVCETCAKHHLRQKLSKDHEMCININEFRYREPKESKKDMKEKQLCEPCSFETLQVPATHYCKTCDDPELLCETCAKHHTKQKPFKDHELSKDIGDFQMRCIMPITSRQ